MLPSSTVENYLKAIFHGQSALPEHVGLVPMGSVAAMILGRLTQRYIELEAESLDKRVTTAPAA